MLLPDIPGLWTLILAGGDGNRLRPLTERLAGDARPKQFCAIVDDETLLERTRRRMQLVARPDRHVVVVNRAHQRFWQSLRHELAPGRLVVQPGNHGTLAGIVYPLLRIRALAGDPFVVITPSDHEVAEERAFAAHVVHAVAALGGQPDRVMILGIEAENPEPEYGWIEPSSMPIPGEGGAPVFAIRRFVEKPSAGEARALFARGCLWNSFVMAGRVSAFLDLVGVTEPGTLSRLAPAGSLRDEGRLAAIYARLKPMSFSDRVLARIPSRLLVAPVKGLGWCDMGTPQRVLFSLQRSGRLRAWETVSRHLAFST